MIYIFSGQSDQWNPFCVVVRNFARHRRDNESKCLSSALIISPPVGMQSIAMSLSVCLFVYLYIHLYSTKNGREEK